MNDDAMIDGELLKHLQKLPPSRVAEVVDFAAFLAHREARMAAVQRLREGQANLDSMGDLPLTEDQVEAAVQESRLARRSVVGPDASSEAK
jgi:uncharacterized protein (DUF433 family)